MDWLTLAKDAFTTSTSYIDTNYRKRWEDNLALFQSKHPRDSKYNQESYKYRSKVFRPKTRSVVRKNEAAAAAAFFSNIDVINIEAENDADPVQQASAAMWNEVLQYRLTKTIPWFITLCGGLQDAQVQGVVCSYQYWKKKEDKPCVELIPVENIRIDPAANWADPINTSPYVIWMMPMYVGKIREMQDWHQYEDDVLKLAITGRNDTTRQMRNQDREDPQDRAYEVNDFTTVWVHMNIMRVQGRDYVYHTLGTERLLSEPQELSQVYFHGKRPFVMGHCVIETHKPIPDGPVAIGEPVQRELNEVANQRLDNVKLVLNKHWLVKRGANVDTTNLVRNVPGGVTMVNDPQADVQELNWPDVTSSAYAEQDRMNVDFDELVGNFSQSSVQTNRQLNETVGGMGLIANSANTLTEYLIRTFTETWVEPVLRQLLLLEQYYETDIVLLSLAAEKAQVAQKFGVDPMVDELLLQELTLNVNVGMGATDPFTRVQKVAFGFSTFANIAQTMAQIPGFNLMEVGKEIFGSLGYRDGERFFQQQQQDPQMMAMLQQMQQVIQEQQMQMQQMQMQLQSKEQEFMLKAQAKEQEMALKQEAAQQQLVLKEQEAVAKAELDWAMKVAESERKDKQMLLDAGLKMQQAERQDDVNKAVSEGDTKAKSEIAEAVKALAEAAKAIASQEDDEEVEA